MLRLSSLLVVIVLAIALFAAGTSAATAPPVTAANLRADISEFLTLLPHRRIGYIAAKHFILDPQFRQAFTYLRSQEFRKQWQRIRKTKEYRQTVAYIKAYGRGDNATAAIAAVDSANDVSNALDELPNKLRDYKLPAKVPVSVMLEAQRDLTSFLHELVASLSREQIHSWLARKVAERGAFASFYKALRDEQFKQLVQTARNSSNLVAPIAELSLHHVNVDELIAVWFEVLAWGP